VGACTSLVLSSCFVFVPYLDAVFAFDVAFAGCFVAEVFESTLGTLAAADASCVAFPCLRRLTECRCS